MRNFAVCVYVDSNTSEWLSAVAAVCIVYFLPFYRMDVSRFGALLLYISGAHQYAGLSRAAKRARARMSISNDLNKLAAFAVVQ